MKGVLPASKGGGGEGIEWERVGGSFGGWARSKAVTILFLTCPDAKEAVQNCQSYKTITLHYCDGPRVGTRESEEQKQEDTS